MHEEFYPSPSIYMFSHSHLIADCWSIVWERVGGYTTNGRDFNKFSSNNKCIVQVMLSWINRLIKIQVDYARLIYYRGQFWNKSSWCRNCNVNNTLKESRFWLRTIIKHMTNLTTIHTSTCITTSLDLISRHSFLGFVPRVVVPTVATFSFEMLAEGRGLRRPIKVCFSVLKMSPRSQSVRSIFTTTGSKAPVTAKSLMLKNDRMVSFRSRLQHI
jgi:hypothetical protein